MDLESKEFQIKRLQKEDHLLARELFLVLNSVFEIERPIVHEDHLIALLNNPQFICFAAINKNNVLGGLTAYEFPMYNSSRGEIFLYDIAISPQFQRKGIGKRLLLALNNYGKEKGIKEVFVNANVEDKHALDFYRSTNATEDNVVQFNYKVI
jgi:aminoglycoside 3-N-acetyltransferase I